MANHDNSYVVLGDDGMVDISSGNYGDGYSGSGAKHSGGGMTKKTKIILISSIAAAVVVAAGVAGFFMFNNGFFNKRPNQDENSVFTFASATVSGIDISGKTEEQAKELLEKNKSKFIKPVDITVNVADKSTKLTQDNFEYTYNIDEVLKKAKSDAVEGVKPKGEGPLTYNVTATVTDKSIESNVKKIAKDSDTEPKNAHVTEFHPYSDDRFEFAEKVNGVKVDTAALKAQIKGFFNKGNDMGKIEAQTETKEAEMDEATLEKSIEKLASYETYSTNTANGTNNMKVALEACNGSIIDPDEVWSFNECTGDSNLESNGYSAAHVISEGRIIDGIGGGICQASSTIYNAAIRANMETVERYAHKWASNYVPTGLDATIDYPNLDLKLKNVSPYQMFIECKLVDSTLYVSIWGVKNGDYDEIRTHNELGSASGSSYSVRAWRVYIKGGKEVDREELFSSSYDLANGMYFIGADTDDQAVDRDVDNATDSSDNSSSGSSSSSGNSSGQSYEEPSYVEPESQTSDEPSSAEPEPQSQPDEASQPSEETPADSSGE